MSFRKLCVTAIVAMLFAGCGSPGSNGDRTLDESQAAEQVRAYVKSGQVQYREVQHEPDTSWVGVDTTTEDLPSINKYPLSVQGKGQLNVEIFASTEKSNAKQDRWLDTMARRFNDSGATVNGRRISVSVRPIASGLALDYITSKKHIPGAYSPSNELWAAMINQAGIKADPVEKRLTGNVAGILMKKASYDNFTKSYGSVTVPNVLKAMNDNFMDGKFKLAHTDPNQSSTGLNFLTQELLTFDNTNPVSQKAAEAFRIFQSMVPPTSPTTEEMSKVAAKNLADAMIMEAQAFKAEPKLASDWVFTPAGVRHDSPLYALNDLPKDQVETLRQFANFVKSTEGQRSASDYGFNQYDEYPGVNNRLTGAQLFGALDIWKQNKDAGQPVVSVFVVDRSGSMDGSKLERAKQALRTAGGYINPGNYVGVVSYSSSNDITVDLPIGKFDDAQRSRFVGAVNSLRAGGDTATNSALVAGLNVMLDAKESIPNAKLRIIVMSDGAQNTGLSRDQAGEVIGGLRVPVFGVGFEANLTDLDKLSQINEGYTINADQEDAPAKLKALVRGAL